MFWLKVVRILASPRGRNFSVASPLLKEAGGLSPAFDRSPPPERPFSVKTGGAGGVYATIFVNGSCPEGQGPGDASTPAELPERRTIGKRTTSPNERLYVRAPTLSSAVMGFPAGGQNFRPAGAFSAKVRARQGYEAANPERRKL